MNPTLIAEIDRYAAECAHDGWDGYGGGALLPQTVEYSKQFANSLKPTFVTPNVFPDPNGELYFEWDNELWRICVCVLAQQKLSYSVTYGKSRSVYYGHCEGVLLPIELEMLLFLLFSDESKE